MTTIPRRLAQLEAKHITRARRFVWQPDDVLPGQAERWLTDVRRREGWAETDDVTVYGWSAPTGAA